VATRTKAKLSATIPTDNAERRANAGQKCAARSNLFVSMVSQKMDCFGAARLAMTGFCRYSLEPVKHGKSDDR
jgi:hypothetical protein